MSNVSMGISSIVDVFGYSLNIFDANQDRGRILL